MFAERDIQQGGFLAFYQGEKITEDGLCGMSEAGNAELFCNKNWNKYIDGKDYDRIEWSMNDCGLLTKPNTVARAPQTTQNKHIYSLH